VPRLQIRHETVSNRHEPATKPLTAPHKSSSQDPSPALEQTLTGRWVDAATLVPMDVDLQQIAAVVIALGAAVVFALMAWAGQHQS
jgi:hypothetical protein